MSEPQVGSVSRKRLLCVMWIASLTLRVYQCESRSKPDDGLPPTQTFLGVRHAFLPHERSWGRNA